MILHPAPTPRVESEANLDLRAYGSADSEEREQIIEAWAPLVCWFLSAVARMPPWRGLAYRGVRDDARMMRLLYTLGRTVQWGGFTSTSTDFATALSFAGEAAVVLSLQIVEGTDVSPFCGHEAEVLLMPNSTLVVSSEPRTEVYEDALYTVIDLVQLSARGTLVS